MFVDNYHKFIYKVTQLALKMKTTNEECRDARNKIDLEYEEERNGITREMAKVKENLGEILLLHNKGIREKVGIEEECEEERRELVLERERLEEDRMELIRERERLEEELKENRMELVRERKILEEEREEERRELVRERERLEKAREEELKTLALRKARAETTKAEHETKLMLAQAMLAEAEWEIRMAQVQAVRKMNHLKDENENEEDDDGTSMPGTLTPSLSLTS